MGYGLYNNSCVPVTTNGAMTNGTMTNGTMTNGAMMNCGMGSVSTQYGCMPQGNCPAGYGMYNGSCVPATQAGTTGFCSAGMTQNYSQCVPAGSTTTQGGYPSSYGSGYYGYGYGYLEQNRPQ